MEQAKGFGNIAQKFLLALTLVALAQASASAATFDGRLYFTGQSGVNNVFTMSFAYNDVTHALTSQSGMPLGSDILGLARIPTGADGIIFTTDGKLAVSGEAPRVYKVDPAGGIIGSVSTGGTNDAFHLMMAPNGTIYSTDYTNRVSAYNGTLTTNGTPFTVTGSTTNRLATFAFPGGDSLHGFYTASGPPGFGDFGTLNLQTNTATSLLPPGTLLPAAHGLVYDPFTNTLILSGANHVTQLDLSGNVLSDLVVPGALFDQLVVDGFGHVFVANQGNGTLLFLDISSTGRVGTPNFQASPNVGVNIDDIAPLIGPGAGPMVPEPGSLVLLGLGGMALLGYYRRCR